MLISNKLRFAYLATPYSDPSDFVREDRFRKVTRMAAKLMEAGIAVHSPITQGHAMVKYLPEELKHSHDFWLQADIEILSKVDFLIVLTLDGWQTSRGVTEEIDYAYEKKLPIVFMDADVEVNEIRTTIKEIKNKLLSMEVVQNATIN